LNKKNCFVIKQIFNINNKHKLNLYEGDTLNINLEETFGIDKFDIIIGNPPYNENLTSTGAKPLYNKFIEYYINKCKLLSFVVPSRWFSSGKCLGKFRKMMINRSDILYMKHYDDACKIFGNLVNIKGGVNYFLIDVEYNGLCNFNECDVKFNNFDVIFNSKYYNIVNKILNYNNITDLYLGRYFGIETNDKNLSNDNKLIKCFVSQQKGFVKYIDKKFIKKEYNFYKVITTRSAFGSNSGFGNTFIGTDNEVHTGTYISFRVSNENNAKSLLSYMKCKLPNLLLSLRKSSQSINKETCKWIPLIPLDKEWTDDEVYKYFKFSEDVEEQTETSLVNIEPINKVQNEMIHIEEEVIIKSKPKVKKIVKKIKKPLVIVEEDNEV
jgi:site-specific DNA-methyltransferase (adenine-specific)